MLDTTMAGACSDTALWLALCPECVCHRWVSSSRAVELWLHCHPCGWVCA